MNFLFCLLPLFQTSPDSLSWTDQKIDQFVSAKIPGVISRTDTLGQTLYFGELDQITFILQRVPSSATPIDNFNISNSSELHEFYDGMQEALVSEDGTIMNVEETLVGSFECRRVTANYYNLETRFYQILMIKDVVYTSTVICNAVDREKIEPLATDFFDSHNITSNSTQFLKKESNSIAYNMGYLLGKATLYLFIPAILLIIFLGRRRIKKRSSEESW